MVQSRTDKRCSLEFSYLKIRFVAHISAFEKKAQLKTVHNILRMQQKQNSQKISTFRSFCANFEQFFEVLSVITITQIKNETVTFSVQNIGKHSEVFCSKKTSKCEKNSKKNIYFT